MALHHVAIWAAGAGFGGGGLAVRTPLRLTRWRYAGTNCTMRTENIGGETENTRLAGPAISS